jgi:hypothetical protein
MIYDLKWNHPAVVLFLAIVVLGGWVVHLESTKAPEAFVHATYGLHWSLVFVGVLLIAWGPLYMIARPSDWMPRRSLAVLEATYLRREAAIRCTGYVLEVAWLAFVLWRLWTMLKT